MIIIGSGNQTTERPLCPFCKYWCEGIIEDQDREYDLYSHVRHCIKGCTCPGRPNLILTQ